jgi:2-dehydro-3-deoxyphosphogalactonate aldolase
MTLDEALTACPVVAILRGVRPDEVTEHAQALFEAGIRAIEAPLNSPYALESMRRLVLGFGEVCVCGAGTVLTTAEVEAVAEAGGALIVSPNADPVVIARTVKLGLASAPGVATPTEAFAAIAAGARHLKLFPASSYGPGHLKQLKAVLPALVTVIAVGGIGPNDMAVWREAGAAAFGMGSELYKPGQTPADTAAKAARVVEATRALGE